MGGESLIPTLPGGEGSREQAAVAGCMLQVAGCRLQVADQQPLAAVLDSVGHGLGPVPGRYRPLALHNVDLCCCTAAPRHAHLTSLDFRRLQLSCGRSDPLRSVCSQRDCITISGICGSAAALGLIVVSIMACPAPAPHLPTPATPCRYSSGSQLLAQLCHKQNDLPRVTRK